MRLKSKSISEINDILESSDFKENQNDDILIHLKRGECPYCGSSISVYKGNLNFATNNSLLYKSSCSLKSFKDSSSHIKNSCNVKGAIHLIIKSQAQDSLFIQDSGNLPDIFIYDED